MDNFINTIVHVGPYSIKPGPAKNWVVVYSDGPDRNDPISYHADKADALRAAVTMFNRLGNL